MYSPTGRFTKEKILTHFLGKQQIHKAFFLLLFQVIH